MNIINKSVFYNSLIGVFIFINIAAVKTFAQTTPPVPEKPSSTLQYPEPVIDDKITGRAVIPAAISQGFAVDLAGKVLTGNWDIKGRVLAIEKGEILLKTEKQETGRFVYRLPKSARLPVKVDQQISILKTLKGFEGTLGYIVRVDLNNSIALASGRIFGNKPIEVKILEELSLKQVSGKEEIISNSKFEKMSKIPVLLQIKKEEKLFTIGEPYEFDINDKKFVVIVNESSNVIPTKEYEAISEGKGYTLEYAIILKE